MGNGNLALSVCDPVYDDSVLHEEMRLVTRCRPRDMELGKLDFDSLSRVRSNPIELSFHYSRINENQASFFIIKER